tara:strand:- start:158 stop:382 length:225 start_codon:yes stop_codon:yes gene_type:complete
LNILLIPLHGTLGAALATCLVALVGFITTVYYSQAYYPIPYNWKRMIIAAVVLFMALSFYELFLREAIGIFIDV